MGNLMTQTPIVQRTISTQLEREVERNANRLLAYLLTPLLEQVLYPYMARVLKHRATQLLARIPFPVQCVMLAAVLLISRKLIKEPLE